MALRWALRYAIPARAWQATTTSLAKPRLTAVLLPVGDFATADISAGYTYRKVSIPAQISNVTNTINYLIHDNYSITSIAPRQFLTSVAYKF